MVAGVEKFLAKGRIALMMGRGDVFIFTGLGGLTTLGLYRFIELSEPTRAGATFILLMGGMGLSIVAGLIDRLHVHMLRKRHGIKE